ncbi:4-hydroxybenzoate--CoA ligase [Desulfocarbo indianensis]|nr:4-hydroxybenzoate--CoA ligase [Desulfocarbo indianensis]
MHTNYRNLPFFNAASYFIDRNIEEGRENNIAVICDDRRMTYGQISDGVNRFGNALKKLGIRIEDRVALLLLDSEVYPQAFFGAIKIGAVPICLNTLMRPKDYLYFLNDSRARMVVVDASLLPEIEPIRDKLKFLEHVVVVGGEAPQGDIGFESFVKDESRHLECAPTGPDDVCFWLYSSGSTGNPKGTVHLHHDMVFAAETYGRSILNIQESDRCFSAAKLFFAYGLGNGLYFPFSVGASTVYLSDRPTPEAVFEVIERHRPTLYFGVPTLYGTMLETEGSLHEARMCISAGEALPPDLLRRWKERFGVPITDGIGSTEMAHIFISNYGSEARPGCTGKPVPGYEARIVDEKMQDLPDGEVGNLLVKGDSAAAFYWNKHEKTKETMLGEWINTGDKFYKDADGFYYYVGRSNDMLKVGGIWVSPIEVESCVTDHPSVLECAVIGAADGEGLIKPKAFVVLRNGIEATPALAREIQIFVKSALAHYKYPRWINFVEELPKTKTGKIMRYVLKEQEVKAAA